MKLEEYDGDIFISPKFYIMPDLSKLDDKRISTKWRVNSSRTEWNWVGGKWYLPWRWFKKITIIDDAEIIGVSLVDGGK